MTLSSRNFGARDGGGWGRVDVPRKTCAFCYAVVKTAKTAASQQPEEEHGVVRHEPNCFESLPIFRKNPTPTSLSLVRATSVDQIHRIKVAF